LIFLPLKEENIKRKKVEKKEKNKIKYFKYY
jgi:hypothetical protein